MTGLCLIIRRKRVSLLPAEREAASVPVVVLPVAAPPVDAVPVGAGASGAPVGEKAGRASRVRGRKEA